MFRRTAVRRNKDRGPRACACYTADGDSVTTIIGRQHTPFDSQLLTQFWLSCTADVRGGSTLLPFSKRMCTLTGCWRWLPTRVLLCAGHGTRVFDEGRSKWSRYIFLPEQAGGCTWCEELERKLMPSQAPRVLLDTTPRMSHVAVLVVSVFVPIKVLRQTLTLPCVLFHRKVTCSPNIRPSQCLRILKEIRGISTANSSACPSSSFVVHPTIYICWKALQRGAAAPSPSQRTTTGCTTNSNAALSTNTQFPTKRHKYCTNTNSRKISRALTAKCKSTRRERKQNERRQKRLQISLRATLSKGFA